MAVAMEAAPVEAAVETAEDVASDALRLQTFYWTLYIETEESLEILEHFSLYRDYFLSCINNALVFQYRYFPSQNFLCCLYNE